MGDLLLTSASLGSQSLLLNALDLFCFVYIICNVYVCAFYFQTDGLINRFS